MNPHRILYYLRHPEDALITALLLVILVGGSILWEKVKTRWREWKLNREKGS
jgi:hypothetical protein